MTSGGEPATGGTVYFNLDDSRGPDESASSPEHTGKAARRPAPLPEDLAALGLEDAGDGSCSVSSSSDAEDNPSSTSPTSAAWDRERRELEMSKANFARTMQRQAETEQSVSSLLQRLSQLSVPHEMEDTETETETESVTASQWSEEPESSRQAQREYEQMRKKLAALSPRSFQKSVQEPEVSRKSHDEVSAKLAAGKAKIESGGGDVQEAIFFTAETTAERPPQASAVKAETTEARPSQASAVRAETTAARPPQASTVRAETTEAWPAQASAVRAETAAARPPQASAARAETTAAQPPQKKPSAPEPLQRIETPLPPKSSTFHSPLKLPLSNVSTPEPGSVTFRPAPEPGSPLSVSPKAPDLPSSPAAAEKVDPPATGRLVSSLASLASSGIDVSPHPFLSARKGLMPKSPPPESTSNVKRVKAASAATPEDTSVGAAEQAADYTDEIHVASAAASPSNASGAFQTAAAASPTVSPRTRLQMGHSPADQSLLPRSPRSADQDLWRGWAIETTQDGRLFYYHASTSTSQWQMPRELVPVLGEWLYIADDEGGEGAGAGEGRGSKANGETAGYWRNNLLGVSAWRDPRHSTNLFQAALDQNLFFLQLYTEVGGFLDASDAKGRTALHYNCAGGSTQAVAYLLQNKASVAAVDQVGSTPLHWASRYGHELIVRILLEASADPDCQNALGDTAMHEAAALGRANPLHWLLAKGADPALKNRESRTAVEVAVRNHAVEAAAVLRRHGERMHAQLHDELADSQSEDSDEEPETARPHRFPRDDVDVEAEEHANSNSDESETEATEPSLALVIVRAARPLLRGVQWLANRVLGEKKADLGAQNGYYYDAQTQQWVLGAQDARIRASGRMGIQGLRPGAVSGLSDGEDSESSDGEEDEVPTLSAIRSPIPPRKPRQCVPSHDSDGMPGP